MVLELSGELIIGGALIMGIILSLIEIHFVHVDEAGMRWFSHAMHAVPFMFVFIFISMNIPWVLDLVGFASNLAINIGVSVLVGIIAMVKIKAAASITGRGGVGESNMHILIIGVLIIASPYIWELGLEPFVGQYIPF
ncbi:MAG: hypothetical protein ACMXX6_01115 [Candidatus Woesearchaeota archaeon]